MTAVLLMFLHWLSPSVAVPSWNLLIVFCLVLSQWLSCKEKTHLRFCYAHCDYYLDHVFIQVVHAIFIIVPSMLCVSLSVMCRCSSGDRSAWTSTLRSFTFLFLSYHFLLCQCLWVLFHFSHLQNMFFVFKKSPFLGFILFKESFQGHLTTPHNFLGFLFTSITSHHLQRGSYRRVLLLSCYLYI